MRRALAILFLITATISSAPTVNAAAPGDTLAWGFNDRGQLGDGTTTSHLTPAATNAATLDQIAGGRHHVVGLNSAAKIVTWGWNNFGQIGNNTLVDSPNPIVLASPSNVASVAAGHYHSLAITTSGSVFTWGRNTWGQIGDGTTTNRKTPVSVAVTNAVQASAGREFSVVLRSDGTVRTWGTNTDGQLGTGNLTDSFTPVAVPGLNNVTAVTAGRSHIMALRSNGTVVAWGDNQYSQLGDGTTTDRTSPVTVGGLPPIVELASFGYHSLALDNTGQVWAWGLGEDGQMGDGTTRFRTSTPIQVPGLDNVVTIGAGRDHSAAATDDGELLAWGNNDFGQVGDGTTVNRSSPVVIATGITIDKIVAGRDYTAALEGGSTPPVDTVKPNSTITTPAHLSTVASGNINLSGNVTDNSSGVATVRIYVRDRDSGQWLQPNGSFAVPYAQINANVSTVGSNSTTWSKTVNLGSGRYGFGAVSVDVAGNTETSKPWSVFDVTGGGPLDVDPPESTIVSPTRNATLPAGALTLSGTASDDVSGVATVGVYLRDKTTKLWLQADQSWAAEFVMIDAIVNGTDWSLGVNLPAGSYGFGSRATDNVGRVQSTRPWVAFNTVP